MGKVWRTRMIGCGVRPLSARGLSGGSAAAPVVRAEGCLAAQRRRQSTKLTGTDSKRVAFGQFDSYCFLDSKSFLRLGRGQTYQT